MMKIKNIKIIVQWLIFIVICMSFWYLRYPLIKWFDATYFFQLSPVVAVVSVFFTVSVLFCAALIIFTFIFGRVFCGWICPYGTIMDFIGYFIKLFKISRENKPKTIKSKYLLLASLIFLTFFGVQLFWLFEPVTIFGRAFYFSIYPFANNTLIDIFYKIMSSDPGDITASIYQLFKNSVIENNKIIFTNHLLSLSLFLVPLILLFVRRRFWCRYICPLGSSLAVISKFSLLQRKSEICTAGCGKCVNLCRMNAINGDNSYIKQECILCMDCLTNQCLKKSEFIFKMPEIKKNKPVSNEGVTRKDFIVWSVFTVVLLFFKKRFLSGKSGFIRPPGAVNEDKFKQKCIRCGNCMKACVTNGLQPVMLESGLDGIWTPKLDSKIGYCEYECVLCGEVCPTQAIERLTEAQKMKTKIGLAAIQKDICVPWKDGIECLVCEEHCPIPSKAIKFKIEPINGKQINVPYVEKELCVGCAICENKCPVAGKKGIIAEPV